MPTIDAALYLTLFFAPFFQEDIAVFGAAGAAASSMLATDNVALFMVALAGLITSDTWKFWAGRLAQRHPRLRKWAEKPAVSAARERVLKRLGLTMLAVRFVPGTRIGAYIAAGFFGAPFIPFFFYVVSSGILYLGIAFVVVHIAGVAAGHQANQVIAGVVITLVLIAILSSWLRNRRKAKT